MNKRMVALLVTILVVAAVNMLIGSILMTDKLAPIQRRFTEVVRTTEPREVFSGIDSETGHPRVALDYGGEIDSIIAERDIVLKENGYVILGYWRIREQRSPVFLHLYLYTGGLF